VLDNIVVAVSVQRLEFTPKGRKVWGLKLLSFYSTCAPNELINEVNTSLMNYSGIYATCCWMFVSSVWSVWNWWRLSGCVTIMFFFNYLFYCE